MMLLPPQLLSGQSDQNARVFIAACRLHQSGKNTVSMEESSRRDRGERRDEHVTCPPSFVEKLLSKPNEKENMKIQYIC